MELERIPDRGPDPGGSDVRTEFCVDDCSRCSFFGGRLTPCSFCEWRGLCSEYHDEPGDGPA